MVGNPCPDDRDPVVLVFAGLHDAESSEPSLVPYQDFREFLDTLRAQGELIDVDRPVALDLEVAKAMRKSAAVAGPAIVFRDNGTPFSLVGGVYNSNAKALLAYGCDAA